MTLTRRSVLLAAVTLPLVPKSALAFAATVSYSQVTLTATVNGAVVTTSGEVEASANSAVNDYGIAVWISGQETPDTVHQYNVTITTIGNAISGKTGVLKPGTYIYWLYVNKPSAMVNWLAVGPKKTFTVSAAASNDIYKDRY
jgi:hypothetical protein